MELESVKYIRDRYLSLLSNDENYNNVIEIINKKSDSEPLSYIKELDAESDLTHEEEQRQLSEILLDMHSINNGVKELKDIVVDSLNSLDTSLQNIFLDVNKQIEQVEDINTICGLDSAYSSVLPIYASDFQYIGSAEVDKKTISASPVKINEIDYDIISIGGNGYSGNAFVYNNETFENEDEDKSDPIYIMDSNDLTVYEYSRLCTHEKQESISGIINFDDKEVECIITMSAKQKVCQAEISSDDQDLVLKKIEISDDGMVFTTYLDRNIRINDTNECYTNPDYIYGAGIICFPYTKFVRITLSNNTVLNDVIAIEDDDGKIKKVNAYRKKISIKNIRLFDTEYEENTFITNNILQDSSVDKVALFVSEYIPDHFTDTGFIDYSLIVNGHEYNVFPVNSSSSGKTMVKFKDIEVEENGYSYLLKETIKTVKVKITIRPFNKKETPFVSNIKLCMGKNTGNIYV